MWEMTSHIAVLHIALLLEAMSAVSESVVLQALQLACSQDPSVLKLGEKQLDAWKNEKGYYGTLAVRAQLLSAMQIQHENAQFLITYRALLL